MRAARVRPTSMEACTGLYSGTIDDSP